MLAIMLGIPMADSNFWDVISGPHCDQTIVGIGFPAGHHVTGFAELAERIGSGYRYLHAKLPAARAGERICGRAYAASCIEDIRRDHRPVLAVLGYRVGSVYAAAVAEGISQWQEPPIIMLFDPERADGKLLSREFRGEIDATRSLLSDDEIERAEKIAAEIATAGPGEVTEAAAEALGNYLAVITVALERVGLGGVGANFTASFESYISWISAASQIDPSRAWEHSAAFDSFEVGYADVLRSDPVALAIRELLAAQWPIPRIPDFRPRSNVTALI
jgi:hypothetical protein